MTHPPRTYPLTGRQRLLWVAHQLQPEAPLYNVGFSFHIRGELDPQRFSAAFDRVVQATDVFRTVIHQDDEGNPCAEVLSQIAPDLAYLDETAPGRPSPGVEAFVHQPFALDSRLFRSRLIRTGKDTYVWTLVMHHLITDTVSFQLIYERVAAAYASPDQREAFPGFAEIAASLDHKPGEAAQAYWAGKMPAFAEDFSFYCETDTGHAHPVERFSWQIGESDLALVDSLRDSSVGLPAHRFNIFAGLYAVFLARLGSTAIPVIAMVSHGRRGAAQRQVPGFFLRMLPLAVPVDAEDDLPILAEKVRREAVAAIRHGDMVLANSQQHRFMHASLNFQVASFPPFNGLPVDLIWHPTGWNEHSLVLNVHAFTGGPLTISLDISKSLLDEAMRADAAARFERLLFAFLRDPALTVAGAPVLDETETRRVLHDWQGSPAGWPAVPLIRRFTHQATEHRQQTAYIFQDQRISFGELQAQANRLARHLLAQPGLDEGPVGIGLAASIEAAVALLAVLKTGRPYLMLPPDLPPARRGDMLQRSGAAAIITLADRLPELAGFEWPVICLDRDAEAIGAHPETSLPEPCDIDAPLYLAYTSGSTGRPKGVSVPQRQLLMLFDERRRRYPVEEGEVLLHKTHLGFVDSTIEFFEGLLQGAATVILSDEEVRDPERLVQAIERHGVTRTRFIPDHLSLLIDSVPDIGRRFARLRLIANTAAAILPTDLEKFQRALPHVVFINTFGLTELVGIAYGRLEAALVQAGRLPVGRPIAGRQVYILDRLRQPVPPLVPGDLYLGGPDLALGYVDQPEEDTERFVEHPFRPGERLFNSGDVARWRADGSLEHLGRRDQQVKVRGQRVELAEIEHHLAALPEIREALVRAVPMDGRTLLAAYLVYRSVPLDPGDLRSRLASSLPDTMIPHFFIALERIPRTPSGKPDPSALPAPALDFSQRTLTSAEAPAGAIEARLAEIWQSELELGVIARSDDFFALGGDSLTAIRIQHRVQQTFNAYVPITAFVEASTIAEQARLIEGSRPQIRGQRLVPLQPDGRQTPLFVVPPAGATVLVFSNLLRHLPPDLPVYGLQPWGLEGERWPHLSIPRMAADYIRLIRAVSPEGPYQLAGMCFGGIVVYEMARQLHAQGRSARLVALLDTLESPNIPRRARIDGLFRVLRNALFGRTSVPVNLAKRIQGDLSMDSTDSKSVSYIDRVYVANAISRYLFSSKGYEGKLSLFFAEGNDRPGRVRSWQQVALEIEIHSVPGTHSGKNAFTREPHVRVLAERLGRLLVQEQTVDQPTEIARSANRS